MNLIEPMISVLELNWSWTQQLWGFNPPLVVAIYFGTIAICVDTICLNSKYARELIGALHG